MGRKAVYRCSKCGITSRDDPSVTFHRFPLPSGHGFLKSTVWAKYCFPENDWSSKQALRLLYMQKRLLCSNHFDDSSFTNLNRIRLNYFAIPTEGQGILRQIGDEPLPRSNSREDLVQVGESAVHMQSPGTSSRSMSTETWSPSQHTKIKPDMIEVCRICLATDGNRNDMHLFKKFEEQYEVLTGIKIGDEENLPQYVCTECSERLRLSVCFKNMTWRAHLWLQYLVKKHSRITVELVKSEKAIHRFDSDLGDILNEDNLSFDKEDEVTELTDERNDTTIENSDVFKNVYDVKFEVDNLIDRSYINDDDKRSDIEDTAVNKIKTENNDLANEEVFNASDLKKETVDVNIENDGVNEDVVNEVAFKQNVVYSPKLYEDAIGNVVKFEYSDVAIEYSPKIEKTSDCMNNGVIFQPRDFGTLKIDNQKPPETDGGSTDDQTVSGIQLLEHSKDDASKSYCCDMCDYITDRRNNLCRHVQTQHDDVVHSCKICEKVFTRKSSLKAHMTIHSDEKPYSCAVCKKSFKRIYQLKIHMTIHYDEKPQSCAVCKKLFKRQYQLENHMNIHTDEKPYKCNVCEKAFRYKWKLTQHLSLYYIDSKDHASKSYCCGVCDYTTDCKIELHRHVKKHDDAVHWCRICKISFNYKCSAKIHMRVHSGEKTYPCNVCKESFMLKHQLKTHMNLHSDENRYNCNVCEKVFRYKWQLQKHLSIFYI